MLECRSMKQLDESHIFITEKHITRKPICVGWELGNTLKIGQAFDPSGRHKSNILTIKHNKDNFFAAKFINRLKSTSLFLTVYRFLQQVDPISAGGIHPLEVFPCSHHFLTFLVFTLETGSSPKQSSYLVRKAT